MLALLTLSAKSAISDDLKRTTPDYVSMSDVKGGVQFISRIWNDDGIVLVGKLVMPHDEQVSSHTPLYDDSSYCAALYKGRRLVFFAHGYDPLEITNYSNIATNVYDAGTHQFAKSSPENTRTLRGTVTIENTGHNVARIDCALQIRNDKYLWQDHGTRCGSPINVTVVSAKLDSKMPFVFDGLSRLPYVLVVTSPGYIKKEIRIDQELNEVINLGNIALDLALSYRKIYQTTKAILEQ